MHIKINDCIDPNLINYLKNKYPNKELLERIDKDNFDNNNNESIDEIVLRSEQSNWYKKMGEYSYPETII